jgi:hypothetical protein
MDLFEYKLDAIIKVKTTEANELLEIKAEAKTQRAAEKAAAIESGVVVEKPKAKRGRKKNETITLDI